MRVAHHVESVRELAARVARPVTAYVGVGSNIDPERNVGLALRRLHARFGPLQRSSVYRSPAQGFRGDDFLNMVVAFGTREPPEAVIAFLEGLHAAAGRVRGRERFVSRSLDLDLLLYGDRVIDALRIPRPDITEYGFVLGPLAELAPQLRHPVTGQRMADLWDAFDQAGGALVRLPAALN